MEPRQTSAPAFWAIWAPHRGWCEAGLVTPSLSHCPLPLVWRQNAKHHVFCFNIYLYFLCLDIIYSL